MAWKWWWIRRKEEMQEDEERKAAADAALQKVIDECDSPDYMQELRERDEAAWFNLKLMQIASARFAHYVDSMPSRDRAALSKDMRSGKIARALERNPDYQKCVKDLDAMERASKGD